MNTGLDGASDTEYLNILSYFIKIILVKSE
jgi:hypothetical protein